MKILQQAIKNIRIELESKPFPSCFDNLKQYKNWKEMESVVGTKPRRFPCRDCNVEYQQRMVAAGRCVQVGIPDIAKIMNKGT